MTNKTELANMCFGHLGISIETSNIDATTNTKPQEDAFNLYYDITLQAVLEKYKPDFARRIATLTLVQSDPNDMWDYEYTYPADCLYAVRIWDGNRDGVSGTLPTPYIVATDSSGSRVIWTDQATAQLVYMTNFTSTGSMPAMFAMGFSWLMAGQVAPSVMKDGRSVSADAFLRKGELFIREAMANVANERGSEAPLEAETIRSRTST